MIQVDCAVTSDYIPGRRLCIFCDVTEKVHPSDSPLSGKHSPFINDPRADQFGPAEAARTEAEALRKASVALSLNLAMDAILDSLFDCILSLVPFQAAVILLREGEEELMVAREAPGGRSKRTGMIVKASRSSYLQKVLFEQKPVLIADTSVEGAWRPVVPRDRASSWLGLPLVARGCVVGVLSLSSPTANRFTLEHLRMARSIAVSAAVAIENARVRERAEIYAASLDFRLRDPS